MSLFDKKELITINPVSSKYEDPKFRDFYNKWRLNNNTSFDEKIKTFLNSEEAKLLYDNKTD